MKRKLFALTIMGIIALGIFSNSIMAEEAASGDNFTIDQSNTLQTDTNQIRVDIATGEIYLNGKVVSKPELLAINKEGTTYIPLKTIVKDIYNGNLTYEKEIGVVSVTIGELNIDLMIGSTVILKNSKEVTVTKPLVIENNTVYIPVSAMNVLFDMEMSYDQNTKQINLMAPSSYEPKMPTVFADFEFAQLTFVQGQSVIATDKSYDVEGRRIVEVKWMVDGNTSNASASLNNIFAKPTPGIHKVSLKVKNDQGKWSEWTTKEILIEANQKPRVTQITSDKDTYAQGEEMAFDYQYENEEWEEIVDTKWSYRKVGEADANKVFLCPEHIFSEGDYEVGLMLQDKFGNWSDIFVKTIHISDKVLDTELNYKFNHSQIGEVVDNYERKNYRDYEEIIVSPYEKVQGTYILSDSPEKVTQDGILYSDIIEGQARVNFNHFNDYTGEPKNKKLVILAENVTAQDITIKLLDKIIKGPSSDELYLGQQLLFDYFKGNGNITYTLKPGEKMFLIDTENKNWNYGMGFCGQFDCIVSGRVKITIAAVNKGTTVASIDSLNLYTLPKSIHPRGTFDTIELHYNVEALGGKESYFLIGKGKDEWIVGNDAITHETALCTGNYGIMHTIYITAKEEDIGVLLNPRAGAYRGSIRLNGTLNYAIPIKSFFGTDSTKAAVITTIKRGETKRIDYMLPNGSAAPNAFVLIPKSLWK